MKKIMHINCASSGSTGKIISDIATHTTETGYTHVLCCPCKGGDNPHIHYIRTSLPYEQGLYRRLNFLYGYQYGFAPLSTWKIKHHIKKEKPDLLHLHCLNGYMVNIYSLLRFVKKQQIPIVITNHAEFYYTGGCAHAYECENWMTGCGGCPRIKNATGSRRGDTSHKAWDKMKKALANLTYAEMVSVSPWVFTRAARSPLTRHLPQNTVLNGISTDCFFYRDPVELRKKYRISANTKILFHPTAHFSNNPTDAKGGRYILELAKRFSQDDILIIVAGNTVPGVVAPDNVRMIGLISDQMQLAEYYAMADLTVVAGKRETFNMPVAESLCCGTPVVGFCAGGPESIAISPYCSFVSYGSVDCLAKAIEQMLLQPFDCKEMAKIATEKFAASTMANGYMAIYSKLLSNRRH